MYRESLQNNRERILLSKRLGTIETAVPIEFSVDMVKAREPDLATLKQLFKELEFHSHLKELGPSEDTRARDYQALGTPEAVDAWLAAIPPGAPLAVAIDKSGEGEFALDTVGLAWKRGEAHAVPLQLIDQLRPLLEDAVRPKITCDVKSVLLAVAKLSVEARGFAHDVMLYAFLLDADPGSCRSEERRVGKEG